MITIQNIKKSYKKNVALNDINITFENKVYGLLGPNGSGKTTLLRIMSGLLKPDMGIINYQNKSIKDASIGYLPQKFGIFKELSVYSQLEYYCILKKIPKEERENDIHQVLESVNLEDTQKLCKELSGGMVRRLGIAQTFLGNPDVILLDEPSAGLDVEERLRFKRILSGKNFPFPIIVSTHIVEDVESTCDVLIVLKKGQIIYTGTPNEIKDIALGHVYEISEKEYKKIIFSHYLVKISGEVEKRYRILCDEKLDDEYKREPEIEDGYMYLIKSPFHEI